MISVKVSTLHCLETADFSELFVSPGVMEIIKTYLWLVFPTGATRISGSHSRLTQVVRPRLEGKQRTLLSSRVATCISWRLLSGLKGDRPPVEFGEWTRDCSLGHVGKEGPHLTMTGASREFSRAAVPVWGFHEVGRGVQGASRVAPGKLGFNGHGEGNVSLLSSHGTIEC